MTTATAAFQVLAPARRTAHPGGEPRLVACAVLDALAVAVLLLGTPLTPPLEGLAVAVLHGTAALLLSGSRRLQPSRRWLCVTAVLAVPFVGAAVALAILSTTGRGSIAMGRRGRARRRQPPTMAALRRLGGALSPCDALDSGNREERRMALSALSRRADPEAIALLRRATAGPDPDLALSAALVLDEIGECSERQWDSQDSAEVRHGTG